jgi:glutathione synthase
VVETRRMAFVMDPIERESFSASTTIVLMLEAERRGHEILYVDPMDLGIRDGRACARVTPVTLDRARASVRRRQPRNVVVDDEIHVVFQRKDPPVDRDYVITTQILGTCRQALVLNRPTSVIAYNEKLLALHFRELMPDTLVTRSIPELRDFMAKLGGEMIVKPLDGKGGEGIFHVVDGEKNISSILEQATVFQTRHAMAQRYLPAVREGDKRILLLEGEPLGALLRVPAESESRANLHVGGRADRSGLDAADRRIVERIGPMLRAEGLFFVGIDVIGGLLTEINVTSPTGMQEINRLDGVLLERRVIDRVEEMIAAGVSRA